METIVNKVAESGIITLDLSTHLPAENSIVSFDLRPFLFREMILREKDYRAALQDHNWNAYAGKHVAVHCSVDAIIPVWAYMLAASYLQPLAESVYFGKEGALRDHLIAQKIAALPVEEYRDKRIVLKGCGEIPVPEQAYLMATAQLRPVVKSIMYGEPCSTVPIYKKKATA